MKKTNIAQRRPLSSHSHSPPSPSFRQPPLFVAIVGGSASGKTWLSEKLAGMLPGKITRFSLDSFYRDRSHLSPGRRARINFDHPASIDWPEFKRVLQDCSGGRATRMPIYDFRTHTRLGRVQTIKPTAIFIVDGLWLLCRPSIRAFFALRIFLECPVQNRLGR